MMKLYADEWEELLAGCDFTDEERAVIALLRRGWYGVDIAAEIGISQRTEQRRVRSITAKIRRYMIKNK
ncbi:MAG: hypothetical protein IKP68_08065 [Clostridia bacterium]|nr:hypothetical protein [Clostridia bacterium]